MFKRIIIFVTILSLIFYSLGCSSKSLITVDKLKQDPKYKIAMVVTNKGIVYEFKLDKFVYANLRNNNIEGITKGGFHVTIPISVVKTVYIYKYKPKKFRGVIPVSPAAYLLLTGILVWLKLKESCPFVYSFDGDQYIFDAEPYGGDEP